MTPDEIQKDRALERIWAEAPGVLDDMGFWQPNQSAGLEAYVRVDLFDAMTAERDAALALVAAAYEAAADRCESCAILFPDDDREGVQGATWIEASRVIRHLTPADALTAQAARDHKMRAEGMRDAALTGAVKVKPLVWFKVDTLFHVGEWVAETPGGTLQIIQTKSPPNKFHEVQLGFGDLFDTLEAVQSAAQAKYEACILAALEPNPDDTAALTPADALAAQAARDERMRAEGAKAAEARIERLVENLISAAASLAAAISLLERSGMAVKKAAPSNRMFDQMLIDYRATLESARAALRENGD